MLNQKYPLNGSIKIDETVKISIPKKYLQNTVLGGFLAFIIMDKFFSKMGESITSCDFTKENIVVDWPKSWPIVVNIITDHPHNLSSIIEKNIKLKYYNKYLDDLRPRTITCESGGVFYEIFDNYGRELPVYNLMKLLNYWFPEKKDAPEFANTQNIWLCQSYYIMLYFLLKSYEAPDQSEFYIAMHNVVFSMVHDAEENIGDHEYSMMPFFLSHKTYGKSNWSPDYIVSVKEKLYMLKGQRISLRGPFGFYPDGKEKKEWPPLDISSNELFLIDGKERDTPFDPLEKSFDF